MKPTYRVSSTRSYAGENIQNNAPNICSYPVVYLIWSSEEIQNKNSTVGTHLQICKAAKLEQRVSKFELIQYHYILQSKILVSEFWFSHTEG